jgi:hypothetical protein
MSNDLIISGNIVFLNYDVQLHLYYEITFKTKKKWPYKTGHLLKDVQF